MPLTSAKPVLMIVCRDRIKGEAFYRDVLGLVQTGDDGFALLFDVGGCTLRLTEVPDHQASAHPVLGFEVADIASAVRDLAARGVAMAIYPGMGQDAQGVWTGPDGSKVAFFADPDGNGLSLMQRAPQAVAVSATLISPSS